VSVPRNLVHAQFPPGSALAERYPDGYEDDDGGLLNALYNTVVNDDELSEAYADRIVARLGDSIENLGAATLKRVVVSPTGLEALNRNLVGGDIYGGSCALDQNLLWRPLPEAPGHETAVAGLWHIGASTHPGPGLGAGSGYLAAKQLTKPPLARRLLAKVPGLP